MVAEFDSLFPRIGLMVIAQLAVMSKCWGSGDKAAPIPESPIAKSEDFMGNLKVRELIMAIKKP